MPVNLDKAKITHSTVNDLKSEGHYFAAGALAYALNQTMNYGCHVGMRSTLDSARDLFEQGWLTASTASHS